MDMTQKHLQTALPSAILQANRKLQQNQVQEPKPLVNLKRAVFDACKIGEPFDSTEMIEALGKFGYKPNSIINTLRELHVEGKLRRSQKMPYAYTKLRSWDNESDKPLQVRVVKVKPVKVEDLPRIPPITVMTDSLKCLMEPVKPTTSFSMHDLDLVIQQLTGMKVVAQRYFHTRVQFHPDDMDLGESYGVLAEDLTELLAGMYQMKVHMGKISQMAAAIRSMT